MNKSLIINKIIKKDKDLMKHIIKCHFFFKLESPKRLLS
jgi:hypothetical protein